MTYKQLWNDDYLKSFARTLLESGTRTYQGDNLQFWYEDEKTGNLCINRHILVSKFFPALGIRNLVLGKTAKGLDSVLPVFIRGNRCEEINGNILKTITYKVLKEMDDLIQDTTGEEVRTLLGFSKSIFTDGIRTIPDLYDKEVFNDTRESAYRFFQNGWLEITKEGVQPLRSYDDLPEDKIIWNTSVIARDYVTETDVTLSLDTLIKERIHPVTGEYVNTKKELAALVKELKAKVEEEKDIPKPEYFRDYVENLARNDEGDVCPNNLHNIKVGIGYLCHRHHFSFQRKWVCVIDRHFDIQRKKAEGGNGKSILIKALENVMNLTPLDGKEFIKGKGDKFAFADVTPATEIAFFDDADEKFDIKRLYSRTTGEFHVRRMRENPFSIDGKKAPKIAISSNYPFDNDISTTRRQYLIPVSSFYKDALEAYGDTPFHIHDEKEIAVEGGGWNDWDWNAFYRFVWECIALYLDKKLPKQQQVDFNYTKAQLLLSMVDVPEREELLDYFVEKLNEYAKSGEEVFVEVFYKELRKTFPNLPKDIANRKLYEWLKEIGVAYKLNPNRYGGLNGKLKAHKLHTKSKDIKQRWIDAGMEEHLDANGKNPMDDETSRVYAFKVIPDAPSSTTNTLSVKTETD